MPCHGDQRALGVFFLILAQPLEIIVHTPFRDNSASPQVQSESDGRFKEFGEDVVHGASALVKVFADSDFDRESQDSDCEDGKEDKGTHCQQS
jgi:hypothetical protein